MRKWCDIAKITNTKNLSGGLVVHATASLPFILGVGTCVHIVPPPLECPRKLTVKRVEGKHVVGEYVGVKHVEDGQRGNGGGNFYGAGATIDSAVVYFNEIDDVNMAKNYVGCHCLMEREEVSRAIDLLRVRARQASSKLDMLQAIGASVAIDAQDENNLLGWRVRDTKTGFVGCVKTLLEMPGQLMLVVFASEEGSEGEHKSENGVERESDRAKENTTKRDGRRIATHDEKYSNEILIPVVDEFILDINEGSREILLCLPDGLLDL